MAFNFNDILMREASVFADIRIFRKKVSPVTLILTGDWVVRLL